jgi:hypothetical protein
MDEFLKPTSNFSAPTSPCGTNGHKIAVPLGKRNVELGGGGDLVEEAM